MSESRAKTLPAVNTATLAQIAGLGVRQVQRLVANGVLPKSGRGRYALDAAVPALIRYYRQGAQGSGALAEERLRHTVAQRKEIEQRTAKRSRELIPVDEVRTAFDTAMALIGGQLDGLGGRIANDMAAQSDPAICKKVIFDETRRIRTAAAAELEAFADPTGRRKAAPAAAGDERE
jgi:hypothetical protein